MLRNSKFKMMAPRSQFTIIGARLVEIIVAQTLDFQVISEIKIIEEKKS